MLKYLSTVAFITILALSGQLAQALPGDVVKFSGTGVLSFKNNTADIRAVVIQPDGKIILGGNFLVKIPVTTTINGFNGTVGLVLKNIVRINPDGTVDPTFIAPSATINIENNGGWSQFGQEIIWGFSAPVRALSWNTAADAVDVGGEFINYGQVGTSNVTIRPRLLQLDSGGGLSSTFAPVTSGHNGTIRGLFPVDSDTVISYGEFTDVDGTAVGFGLNGSSGGSTSDWAAQANAPINVAFQTTDGLYLAGEFTQYIGLPFNRIIRVNATSGGVGEDVDGDGVLDVDEDTITVNGTLDPGEDVDGDGKLDADEDTFIVNGTLDFAIFSPEGTGPDGHIRALAAGDNGTDIILVGAFSNFNGNARGRIARIDNTGLLDVAFPAANGGNSSGANGEILSIVELTDGRYLIAGTFTTYNGITVHGLARLEADGSLDQTFTSLSAPLASGQIRGALEDTDGSYLVYGSFADFKTSSLEGIARVQGERLPIITTQPLSTGVQIGDPLVFNVVASDNLLGLPTVATLSFQWQKNGKNINGATTDTLTIDPVTANDGGAYRVLVSTPSYTVASNTVYAILSNPFLGVIPSTGFRAEGIIEGDTVINNDLGGRISLLVDRFGSASGTVTLPAGSKAVSYGFTGQFTSTGSLTANVVRKGLPLLTLTLNVNTAGAPADFDLSNGTSILTDGVNTATVLAWNSRWSKTVPANSYAGNYNVALVTDGADLANEVLNVPEVSQGFGYFSMSIPAATGSARIAGVLSDGTPFSTTGIVWGDAAGTIPVWIPLYSGGGSVLGTVLVDDGVAGKPVTAALVWKKPAGQSKSPDRFGFSDVDLSAVVGSGLYNPAAAPAGALTLNFADGNWDLAEGGLSANFSQGFNVVGGKATVVLPNPNLVKLSLNAKSGLATGQFTNLGRNVRFQSMILTVGGVAIRGNFIMLNSAATKDYLVGGSVSN